MVGEEVAKLITNLGVVNKVLLSSFDPFKIWAAKQENPALVIGTFYKRKMWDDLVTIDDMKREFGDLPNMQQCVRNDTPTGREFMNVLFGSGALVKSTDGSFVVMDYNIFNNEKYSNETFQTFKDNYREDLSFGAFIIDNLALSDAQRAEDEKVLDLLIANNVSCLVTDNVTRLLNKLERHPTDNQEPTIKPPKGFASKSLPTLLVLSATVPFFWLLF